MPLQSHHPSLLAIPCMLLPQNHVPEHAPCCGYLTPTFPHGWLCYVLQGFAQVAWPTNLQHPFSIPDTSSTLHSSPILLICFLSVSFHQEVSSMWMEIFRYHSLLFLQSQDYHRRGTHKCLLNDCWTLMARWPESSHFREIGSYFPVARLTVTESLRHGLSGCPHATLSRCASGAPGKERCGSFWASDVQQHVCVYHVGQSMSKEYSRRTRDRDTRPPLSTARFTMRFKIRWIILFYSWTQV